MASNLNTDVPESIAGYYYQTLLAIRELTNLLNDKDAVGIEKGADVRVFIKTGKKISIEAKFYSNELNKSSHAIIHTIFNFYNNSVNEDQLFFETNVVINDELLEEISNINDIVDVKDNHIKYISCAIMKESMGKKLDKAGTTIKDLFRSFLIEESQKTNAAISFNTNFMDKHYEFYYDKNKNHNIINFFGVEIDKEKIRTLIQKIIFKSGSVKPKYKMIKELKEEITNSLKKFSIEECHLENTVKILVDKFLETTLDDNKVQLINLLDLKNIIMEFKSNDYKLNLKFYNDKFISKMEELDDQFQENIEDSYDGDKKDELIERFVVIREKICGLIRVGNYREPEEFLNQYNLGVVSIHTFDGLISFLTILTVFNDIDLNTVVFCEGGLSNIQIKGEDLCYKKHVDKIASDVVLKKFIRSTVDDIAINDQNESPVIVFSGNMIDSKRPCETDIKNEYVLKITEVRQNRALIKYYKSLDYKCDECIYYYRNDNEARTFIGKFNLCKGWRSWESIN